MKVNNKLKRIEEEWENVMYFEVQSNIEKQLYNINYEYYQFV